MTPGTSRARPEPFLPTQNPTPRLRGLGNIARHLLCISCPIKMSIARLDALLSELDPESLAAAAAGTNRRTIFTALTASTTASPIKKSGSRTKATRLETPFKGIVDKKFKIVKAIKQPGLSTWYTFVITIGGSKHQVEEWQISSSPFYEELDAWKKREKKKELALIEYPDLAPATTADDPWAACTRCNKWRRVVPPMDVAAVNDDPHWHCGLHPELNRVHPIAACCSVPEEVWSRDDWAGWEESNSEGGMSSATSSTATATRSGESDMITDQAEEMEQGLLADGALGEPDEEPDSTQHEVMDLLGKPVCGRECKCLYDLNDLGEPTCEAGDVCVNA